MSNKPDVFVVMRHRRGCRPMPAFEKCVFETHSQAINAMNAHKQALRVYSSSDAREVFVKRTKSRRVR